jgi:putative hemolysin
LDPSFIIRIIILLIFLSLSAFFAASETSLFSLGSLKLERLKEEKHPNSRVISDLLKYPRRLLISIIVGNELVNIGASAIMTSIIITIWGDSKKWIAIGIMFPIILIFCEIIPKSIGATDPEKLSIIFAKPIKYFIFLVTPIRWIIRNISDRVVKIFIKNAENREDIIMEDEFRSIVDISRKEGIIEESERKLIHNVFEFGDIYVSEVMTPRIDIFSLSIGFELNEIIKMVKNSGYSRIPIYEGDKDNIIGILYAKDLFKGERNLKNILRKPYFIPKNKRLDDLFREFQTKRIHLAIVVDEYGGIAGIVTIEDLIKKLFGEIMDVSRLYKKVDGKYIVSSKLLIDEFNKIFDTDIPDSDYKTIGGFILNLFGRLPKVGDYINYSNFIFLVNKVKGTRILEIIVKRED